MSSNTPAVNGEFTFFLKEKVDRNGDKYLFGGIQLINSVLFVRKEPTPQGEPQRWKATLKPYRKPDEKDDSDAGAWDDEDNRDRNKEKRR